MGLNDANHVKFTNGCWTNLGTLQEKKYAMNISMNPNSSWKLNCYPIRLNTKNQKQSKKNTSRKNSQDEHDINSKKSLRHEDNETLTSNIHQYLTAKHLKWHLKNVHNFSFQYSIKLNMLPIKQASILLYWRINAHKHIFFTWRTNHLKNIHMS